MSEGETASITETINPELKKQLRNVIDADPAMLLHKNVYFSESRKSSSAQPDGVIIATGDKNFRHILWLTDPDKEQMLLLGADKSPVELTPDKIRNYQHELHVNNFGKLTRDITLEPILMRGYDYANLAGYFKSAGVFLAEASVTDPEQVRMLNTHMQYAVNFGRDTLGIGIAEVVQKEVPLPQRSVLAPDVQRKPRTLKGDLTKLAGLVKSIRRRPPAK
jgi:hypothetical protein